MKDLNNNLLKYPLKSVHSDIHICTKSSNPFKQGRLGMTLKILEYLWAAKTRQWENTPFLDTLKEIISDDRTFYAFDEIELLKQELLNNDTLIEVKDFGAGSLLESSNLRTIGDITKNTSIPPKYGKLLFRLINFFQPQNVLEIGTGIGISTLYLSLPSKKRKIVTLEGSSEIARIAQNNFTKLNLKSIGLKHGEFSDQLPGTLRNLKSVDFIFIDGDHRKERLLQYFNICLPYINNNTIMVIDDINWSINMNEGWRLMCDYPAVSLAVDLFRLGILFFKKEEPKQQITILY